MRVTLLLSFFACSLVLSACDDYMTKHFSIGVAESDSEVSSSSSSSGSSDSETPDDDDADGLSNDVEERFDLETRTSDSDHDGYGDGIEFAVDTGDPLNPNELPSPLNRVKFLLSDEIVRDTDRDQDGLGDTFESDVSLDPDSPDTDGDGYADGLELIAGSDPFLESSVPTRDEPPASIGTNITGSAPIDTDRDGLSDAIESGNGTQSNLSDSDSDGFSDGIEYLAGSSGRDAASVPNLTVPAPPSTEE